MKITRLEIENYRGIRTMVLEPDDHLTVLVGVNGAGKSTLLDASALMLSWAIARIRGSNARGRDIAELDIYNEAGYAANSMSLSVAKDQPPIQWTKVQTRPGRREPELQSDYQQLSTFAGAVHTRIEVQGNIPLFVYYPVNRAVLDIPLRVRNKHEFEQIDAYDQSLTAAADFRTFFYWFRVREDLENEIGNNQFQHAFNGLTDEIDNREYPDRQLSAVRRALTAFMPDYKNLSIRRKPLRMVIEKQGKELRIDQLSDGEQCLIALLGDLARRLAIANPGPGDPLQGEGIVLIDEVDLHLHPAWQRMLPGRLTEVFPNCQFILSTHSPQVISEVEPQQVRLLTPDEKLGMRVETPLQTLGLTSNDILDEIMLPEDSDATLSRNRAISEQLRQLFRTIDTEDFAQARAEIAALRERLHGDIPDLIQAESLITMLED